jgi:hypothetical protein
MTKALPEQPLPLAMVRTYNDKMQSTISKVLPFKCVQNKLKVDRHPQQLRQMLQRHVQRSQLQSPTSAAKRSTTVPTARVTKTVRFAPTKTVNNFYKSPEDAKQSWYRSVEYTAFDQERKRTVAALHEVHGDLTCLDPTIFTVSGLEHHLYRQQMVDRRAKTLAHVRSVLKQQYANKCSGINDPESLRYISQLLSTQPCKRAHLRGILDYTLNSMLR